MRQRSDGFYDKQLTLTATVWKHAKKNHRRRLLLFFSLYLCSRWANK